MKRKVIYPGSFDPITYGHLDVIERAAKLFDLVVVAVANNHAKRLMLDLATRKSLAAESTRHVVNVEVNTLDGLLVDYAARHQGSAIIRGLRAVSDFETEFQMALMNRQLNESIETIFMMPKDRFSFLSSSIVREIASLNGDISQLVPDPVQRYLQTYFESKS